MTFDKAVELKNSIDTYYIKEGVKFRRFVAPSNSDDLQLFQTDLLTNQSILLDADAKKYSSDNNFEVRGFNVAKFAGERYKA